MGRASEQSDDAAQHFEHAVAGQPAGGHHGDAALGEGLTPVGESPMVANREGFAKTSGGRKLVMTDDPDEYTGA